MEKDMENEVQIMETIEVHSIEEMEEVLCEKAQQGVLVSVIMEGLPHE